MRERDRRDREALSPRLDGPLLARCDGDGIEECSAGAVVARVGRGVTAHPIAAPSSELGVMLGRITNEPSLNAPKNCGAKPCSASVGDTLRTNSPSGVNVDVRTAFQSQAMIVSPARRPSPWIPWNSPGPPPCRPTERP